MAEGIEFRCWDGEYIVFNARSGNTHYLDLIASQIFGRVLQGPTNTSELCAHVAAFLEVEENLPLNDSIDVALMDLHDHGLIERTE